MADDTSLQNDSEGSMSSCIAPSKRSARETFGSHLAAVAANVRAPSDGFPLSAVACGVSLRALSLLLSLRILSLQLPIDLRAMSLILPLENALCDSDVSFLVLRAVLLARMRATGPVW